MDPALDQPPAGGVTPRQATPGIPTDLDRVLREARQQFAGGFAGQCERLVRCADSGLGRDAADEAASVLHRMVGLGGTVGFERVSDKAADIEESVRKGTLSPADLKSGVAALQAAFEQDVAAPPPAPAEPAADAAASFTVLVVEDEPFQRMLLCTQLRKAGHRPIEAATGEEVLEAARRNCPDIILLDVQLPGMDGYTVCKMLKADPALSSIPVAFLSAQSAVDDRLTGLSFGADDFLTKPVDPRELALRLPRLVRRRAAADERPHAGVLGYDEFVVAAGLELRRERCALALIRTPIDRVAEVTAITRDEIRRRDLCAQYDRGQVVVLLPDTGAAAARTRIASVVETCRANGVANLYAGVSASSAADARSLEQMLEEADEALMVARYEGLPAAVRGEQPRGEAPVALKPLVVVGDDDPDVIRIVDAHLAAEGYRRVLTFDGARTLEEVRAQKPDLLVLDLMMPRLTGFDVLAGLREMGDDRPRVIVLSARGRENDVVRAFGLGADDFVAKPFSPQELLARITRLVK